MPHAPPVAPAPLAGPAAPCGGSLPRRHFSIFGEFARLYATPPIFPGASMIGYRGFHDFWSWPRSTRLSLTVDGKLPKEYFP